MPEKFAIAINCMDGRTQKPVIEYMKKNFGIDYVDMITEPGPNKILFDSKDIDTIESLKKRVGISVEKHGSKIIAIAGHSDCAGNPVSDEEQKEHLKKAIEVISSWGFQADKIIALWLGEDFKPVIL